ncbi:MAG: PAS domain-containing sensor histidine kinase [Solirubrobacteraceae bacterium]
MTDDRAQSEPDVPPAEEGLADALIELSQCLVCGFDREARIVRFNHTCEEVTGYAAAEMLGRDARDTVIPPEDREAFGEMIDEAWTLLRAHPAEGHWITATGDRRLITWANRPLRNDHGEVVELVCTGLDITERERAAAELRRLATEQSALRRTATLVASGAPLDVVCQRVTEETAELLGVTTGALVRFDSERLGTVVGRSTDDQRDDFPIGASIPLEGDSSIARVMRTGEVARTDDFPNRTGTIAETLRRLGYLSTAAAPIVFSGRPWGAIVIATKDGGPLPPHAEQRLSDFAELVGLALASTHARAELAASRVRIVQAADEARRRLERDLHDGAQQRLVSLALVLRMARARLDTDPGTARRLLDGAGEELEQALAELRELARGIHPAVLSERGLPAALSLLAERSPFPVTVTETFDDEPPPAAVEAAAYYVASEALANAAKHAGPCSAAIRVARDGDVLTIEIRDDGRGGATRDGGSGLRGLADRVEALRGSLEIDSPPGEGTIVRARLPFAQG